MFYKKNINTQISLLLEQLERRDPKESVLITIRLFQNEVRLETGCVVFFRGRTSERYESLAGLSCGGMGAENKDKTPRGSSGWTLHFEAAANLKRKIMKLNFQNSWLLFTALLLPTTSIAGYKAGTFELDASHSKLGFSIPHLVISTVEGRFTKFEGKADLADTFEKSRFNVKIDSASIDTAVVKRDEHLRSPDFFDVQKFPTITFETIEVKGKPESFKLTGNLSIHGVTKKVTLDAKLQGPVNDGFGNDRISLEAKAKINRKDFGLVWSKVVEAGPMVGDQVTLDLRSEATLPLAKK